MLWPKSTVRNAALLSSGNPRTAAPDSNRTAATDSKHVRRPKAEFLEARKFEFAESICQHVLTRFGFNSNQFTELSRLQTSFQVRIVIRLSAFSEVVKFGAVCDENPPCEILSINLVHSKVA